MPESFLPQQQSPRAKARSIQSPCCLEMSRLFRKKEKRNAVLFGRWSCLSTATFAPACLRSHASGLRLAVCCCENSHWSRPSKPHLFLSRPSSCGKGLRVAICLIKCWQRRGAGGRWVRQWVCSVFVLHAPDIVLRYAFVLDLTTIRFF